MAIFVYRRASSTSARSLATAVEGYRLRRLDRAGQRLPRSGDVVVCWGEAAPQNLAPGVLTLNGGPIQNKFTDAEMLRRAGVITIEVSRTRPAAVAAVAAVDPAIAAWLTAQDLAEEFVEIETWSRTPVMTTGVQQLITSLMNLNTALGQAAPVARPATTPGEWLPRMNNHVGGDDLLAPSAAPDYFSKKLTLAHEYRVHSFDGRSIRAGRKVVRDGYALTSTLGMQLASPWIRSFDGGWRINYDGFESSRAMRELAAAACAALNLTFGAVDIGQTPAGSLVVLEVNRAPGMESGSTEAYARALTRWVSEHGTAEARRQAA